MGTPPLVFELELGALPNKAKIENPGVVHVMVLLAMDRWQLFSASHAPS